MRTICLSVLAALTIIPHIYSASYAQHDTNDTSGLSQKDRVDFMLGKNGRKLSKDEQFEITMRGMLGFIESAAVETLGYYTSNCSHPGYAILAGSGAMALIGYLRTIYNTYFTEEVVLKVFLSPYNIFGGFISIFPQYIKGEERLNSITATCFTTLLLRLSEGLGAACSELHNTST